MRDKIILNDKLQDAFLFTALSENLLSYGYPDPYSGEKFADELRIAFGMPQITNELKQELYQLLLLYDEYRLGAVNPFFRMKELKRNINVSYNTNQDGLYSRTLKIPELDTMYALYIKPMVMDIMVQTWSDFGYLTKIQKNILSENNISLLQYYNYMYDQLVIGKQFVDYNIDYDIYNRFSHVNLEEIGLPEDEEYYYNLVLRMAFITRLVVDNLEYSAINDAAISGIQINPKNYLNVIGEDERYYKLLKIGISNLNLKLPVFKNISSVLEFKQKNKSKIIHLRKLLSSIEEKLRNCSDSKIINQIESELVEANNELIKNEKISTALRISTYMSLPIGIAELILGSSYIGLTISGISWLTQLKYDINENKNNWIMLFK